MKRTANIFDRVVTYQNLLTSFRLAMKGCGETRAACRFFYRLEPELLKIQDELKSGSYIPGRYRFFTIWDPKQRTIAVAPFRDRVVHHAVVGVLTPIYERSFIFDSYATRPNKGTHMTIRRAQKFTRRWPWFLKADIHKYFDSVNHDLLMGIVERKIKDRNLIPLISRIVANAPLTGMGLPIGNLTSQFLANVYLDPFDHYLKDHLGIRGYLRYMDDFVIFAREKNVLSDLKPLIEQYLSNRLNLKLHPKATYMNRSCHGLSFLGMRIFPNCIRVKPENRRRSLKRLCQKIEAWEKGYLDEAHLTQSLTSIVGHLRYFCPNMNLSYSFS